MSKIRTINDVSEYLDRDFAWRIKEISDIKLAAKSAEWSGRRAIIRAGVSLLYAHWEGFVKSASESYLEYVSNQGMKYGQLKECFVVFGVKGHLSTIQSAKKAELNIEVVKFFRNHMNDRARLALAGSIKTESNLRSEVFENIVLSLGLSTSFYMPSYQFIDLSLCDRRNAIAHGQFLDLEPEDYEKISDKVVSLLRAFKTDIENAVACQNHLSIQGASTNVA